MQDRTAQLARDLARLRTGHGPETRRQDLRQRLTAIDPGLRRERNVAKLRLAQLEHQVRTADTRRHPLAELQRAIEDCAQRLGVLDRRIVEALAAIKPELEPAVAMTHQLDPADPAVMCEARAMLRARSWLMTSQIGGLDLPADLVGRMRGADARRSAAIQRHAARIARPADRRSLCAEHRARRTMPRIRRAAQP